MTQTAPEAFGPLTICERDLPLAAALAAPEPVALAVIVGIEGASYRPLGAGMFCTASGQRFGNLSSGCIENDVLFHAAQALQDGQIRQLRYGLGSPFMDLKLPCGGGLDILILPRPDLAALAAARAKLDHRETADLDLGALRLQIQPELKLFIFGKGPEPRALHALACAARYHVALYSPDPETLQGLSGGHHLPAPRWPESAITDPRSAVAMFFHDADWQPQILASALQSSAFYIGAQGSLRAHQNRRAALQALGLSEAAIARLAAPFGLIPSLRDANSLAVSVLAQILQAAQHLR